MYEWIWRKLPGGFGAKLSASAALVVAALALLVFVVFPWVEPKLPWSDVTVNSPTVQQSTPTPAPGATPAPTAVPTASAVATLPAG